MKKEVIITEEQNSYIAGGTYGCKKIALFRDVWMGDEKTLLVGVHVE